MKVALIQDTIFVDYYHVMSQVNGKNGHDICKYTCFSWLLFWEGKIYKPLLVVVGTYTDLDATKFDLKSKMVKAPLHFR